MWSLADTIERSLSEDVRAFPPEALGRVLGLARTLPAALTGRFYFESWLGRDAPRLDLIVKVDAGRRAVLADENLPVPRTAEWARLIEFARRWSDRRSPIHREVKAVWLEFDLEAERTPLEAGAHPRVFIDFHRQAHRQPRIEQRVRTIASALGALGMEMPAGVRARLGRSLSHLPPGATIPYVGLSLSRALTSLRACVLGLGWSPLRYLESIGWPGDLGALRAALLDRLPPATAAARLSLLHVDLEDEPSPRLGIELPFPREGQPKGELKGETLLDDAARHGWCAPGTRAAVASWPGAAIRGLAHEIWPSRIVRQVSHLKAVYGAGHDLALKAYFCVAIEAARSGTLVGSRMWLGDAGLNGAPAPPDGFPARFRPRPAAPRTPKDGGFRVPGPGTQVALRKLSLNGGTPMSISTAQQQALDKILSRASVDMEFRKGLLTSPQQAIFEGLGLRVPASFRVKFIEKGDDIDALVVLPDFQRADGELSDRDLDVVAGGGNGDTDDPW